MKRLQLIGNCTDENLVNEIFGSVSEFARQVEINGNNFWFNNVKIYYSESLDIHLFFKQHPNQEVLTPKENSELDFMRANKFFL